MGFSSFKSYGSKFSKKLLITILSPPPAPVTTTTKLLIAGGIGGISLSDDLGKTWRLPSNQPFVNNAQNQAWGRSAFDGKRLVMGGVQDIAYSDDFGESWTSTGYNLLDSAYKIIYVKAKNIWFAVGPSSTKNTMAISNDGANWTQLADTQYTGGRCYDIIYNGSVYISIGWPPSTGYCMMTSQDGITWTPNQTFRWASSQNGFGMLFDGNRYINWNQTNQKDSNGNPLSNIAVSQDCISWDTSVLRYLPFDIRGIAYNGVDTYVACGTPNGFVSTASYIYWSNDLITWNAPVNNLLGDNAFYVEWNGTYFVISGQNRSDLKITNIWSVDGKTWDGSDNPFNSAYSLGTTTISLPPKKTLLPNPIIDTILTDTIYDGFYCFSYDSNGTLYVGSTGIIQKYVNNSFITVIGNGTSGYSGDGGQGTAALMSVIRDIKFDSNNDLYFTDYGNHAIRKLNISSGIITTIAGNGTAGSTTNGIQANTALLKNPHSIIFDQNDNLYFSSYGNKIINKIDTTGVITTIAGTSGTSGFTSTTFNTPTQIVLSNDKNSLYVADRFNNAIRKVDLNSGVISTVAGNGTNGSSGDGFNAVDAILSAPVAVEVDLDGNIFIGEFRKIRKVDLNGIITTISGTGNAGNTGDGANAIDATFGQIFKIIFDSIGNLLIGDLGNKSIRKITFYE
jgi:sugar lactone lactonase YvrE